jgi:hypothetical protein
MRTKLFPLWFCLWPCFLGVFLPYCTFPGGLKLLNVFWEGVYGLGLWGVDEAAGLSIQSRLLFLGVLVWPIAISTVLFIFGRKIQKINHRTLRPAMVLGLIASTFLVINLDRAQQPPFSNLPTFYRLFFIVW